MRTGRQLLISMISALFIMTGTASAAPVVLSADAAVSTDAAPQEIKLGRRAHESIQENFTFLRDPALRARVATIVGRLTPFMERQLDYEFEILDHEMVNAFSIAGGRIYVAKGMLESVRTDHELAGVIAHELVHADRRHVITQMARNDRMTVLAVIAMIASRGHGAAIMAANALQVAIMGAYSIDIEKEADAYGIDAMANAGYDPVGMLTMQERLMEEAMHRPQIDLGIYTTHPDAKERIEAAEKYIIDHGYKIDRKRSLGCLRTRIVQSGSKCSLTIDDTEVVSIDLTPDHVHLLSDAADKIDRYLRLETAPFDIRIQERGGRPAIFIEGREIIGAAQLPCDVPIDKMRERIMSALSEARASHPLANYFK